MGVPWATLLLVGAGGATIYYVAKKSSEDGEGSGDVEAGLPPAGMGPVGPAYGPELGFDPGFDPWGAAPDPLGPLGPNPGDAAYEDYLAGLGLDPASQPMPGAVPQQPYIDEGTYNVTIPMDEETSQEVLRIQRENAAEQRRARNIELGLVGATTAPFIAASAYKGAKGLKNRLKKPASAARTAASRTKQAATRASRAGRAGRLASRAKAAVRSPAGRTAGRVAGRTVAVAAATPTFWRAGKTIGYGIKGDKKRVRTESARTVASGTEFLSLGAARIDPRGKVRIGTKKFDLDAPDSGREAWSNVKSKFGF